MLLVIQKRPDAAIVKAGTKEVDLGPDGRTIRGVSVHSFRNNLAMDCICLSGKFPPKFPPFLPPNSFLLLARIFQVVLSGYPCPCQFVDQSVHKTTTGGSCTFANA